MSAVSFLNIPLSVPHILHFSLSWGFVSSLNESCRFLFNLECRVWRVGLTAHRRWNRRTHYTSGTKQLTFSHNHAVIQACATQWTILCVCVWLSAPSYWGTTCNFWEHSFIKKNRDHNSECMWVSLFFCLCLNKKVPNWKIWQKWVSKRDVALLLPQSDNILKPKYLSKLFVSAVETPGQLIFGISCHSLQGAPIQSPDSSSSPGSSISNMHVQTISPSLTWPIFLARY